MPAIAPAPHSFARASRQVLVLMFLARIETPTCSVLGSVLLIGLGTLVAAHGEVRGVLRGGRRLLGRVWVRAPVTVCRRVKLWVQSGLGLHPGRSTQASAPWQVRFVWRGVLAMTASQFTEASKLVLMQLLLRGQRLGPLEGLLCFSPFACLSLLVGRKPQPTS